MDAILDCDVTITASKAFLLIYLDLLEVLHYEQTPYKRKSRAKILNTAKISPMTSFLTYDVIIIQSAEDFIFVSES